MCTRPPSQTLPPPSELFHFLPNSPQAGVSQCPTTFAMADTYAVVQKRRATSGPRSGSGACSTEGAPLYSHVTPGTRWPQAPTEEGAQLGGGELTGRWKGWGGPAPSPSGDPHSWILCPRQIWLLVTTRSVPGQTAGPALGALLRKSPCLSRGLGPAPSPSPSFPPPSSTGAHA